MHDINPLVLTVLGMGVTFVILFVINIMIGIFGKIFAEKKIPVAPAIPTGPAAAAPVSAVSPQDDNEVIAAITAAVYACMGSSSSNLVVRSMVRNTAPSAWSNAGKTESMLLR